MQSVVLTVVDIIASRHPLSSTKPSNVLNTNWRYQWWHIYFTRFGTVVAKAHHICVILLDWKSAKTCKFTIHDGIYDHLWPIQPDRDGKGGRKKKKQMSVVQKPDFIKLGHNIACMCLSPIMTHIRILQSFSVMNVAHNHKLCSFLSQTKYLPEIFLFNPIYKA